MRYHFFVARLNNTTAFSAEESPDAEDVEVEEVDEAMVAALIDAIAGGGDTLGAGRFAATTGLV